MATDEFTFTEHPGPAIELVRIDGAKYARVRETILETLSTHGPMTLAQLVDLVRVQLQEEFDGPLKWYCAMVKSDLQACGALRRVPDSQPEKIEIT